MFARRSWFLDRCRFRLPFPPVVQEGQSNAPSMWTTAEAATLTFDPALTGTSYSPGTAAARARLPLVPARAFQHGLTHSLRPPAVCASPDTVVLTPAMPTFRAASQAHFHLC